MQKKTKIVLLGTRTPNADSKKIRPISGRRGQSNPVSRWFWSWSCSPVAPTYKILRSDLADDLIALTQ